VAESYSKQAQKLNALFAAWKADPAANEAALFDGVQRYAFYRFRDVDISQDVCLRVFKSLSSFDSSRGEFFHWLCAICTRSRATQYSKDQRTVQTIDAELNEEWCQPQRDEGWLVIDMGRLPDQKARRMVTLLTAGHTVSEIAAMSGVSRQAVHQYFHRLSCRVDKQPFPKEVHA